MANEDLLGSVWEKIELIREDGVTLFEDDGGLVRGRAKPGSKLHVGTKMLGKELQTQYNPAARWLLRMEREGKLHSLTDAPLGDVLFDVGLRYERGEVQLVGRVTVHASSATCSLVWADEIYE